MNKIIQVKGSNAVGKTTAIKQFIEKNKFIQSQIAVNNKNVFINHNIDYSICILGRYDVKNGGCDRFDGKKQIFDTIATLIKKYNTETIIFEGFIYGKSFSFAVEMEKFCKIINFKYISLFLYKEPNKALETIYKRNNGANINEQSFFSSYKTALNCMKKLRNNGFMLKTYNTDNIKYEEMFTIIEGNL